MHDFIDLLLGFEGPVHLCCIARPAFPSSSVPQCNFVTCHCIVLSDPFMCISTGSPLLHQPSPC